MKTLKITALALLIGGVIGGAIGYSAKSILSEHDMSSMGHASLKNDASNKAQDDPQKAPLYWVAPMDPNYKRDKPGKSPMGMDLIPVFDKKNSADKAGTVKIDAAVENNLGVKTVPVKRMRLSPYIETVGYIAFDESRLWQTNVRVAGWVEKLFINAVGEKVKNGEVLFTLYSPELVKAQEELLNAYRGKRQGLIKGATERLVSLGVDRAQIKEIVEAGRAFQSIEIKAIGDGVIASLNIREGGYISPAQAVISAGPLDEVWVDAEVFERQAHWMKAKSPATMTLDGLPGKKWEGEIDYVYPILDSKTRTLRMRLKFENANGDLKPNMFANIVLEPLSESLVLVIPNNAVIRSGGMTRVVLSEGDGKYRSARVLVGREAGDKIEVLQGLTEHDSVVTSAHFMLDSESSLSADLSRIDGAAPVRKQIWVKGEIKDVMASHRMLSINHEAVPLWNWPSMEMNFTLGEGVEMSDLNVGQGIHFEMQKTSDGQYEILDYKIMPSHSMPDHSMPDHSMPDHSMPDHSMPDHSMSDHSMSDHSMHSELGDEK